MNTLAKYLKKRNESVSQFANRSGIPQPTVWRIFNEKFTPSPETALKINQATNGDITCMELLYPEKDQIQETENHAK